LALKYEPGNPAVESWHLPL